jgi:hypothetical protein
VQAVPNTASLNASSIASAALQALMRMTSSTKLAESLLKIARSLTDPRAQQVLADAAQHYERLAIQLTTKPQRPHSN